MNLNLFIASALVVAIALLGTAFISPKLIRRLNFKGIVSRDMNKSGKPLVPKYGGVAMTLGFVLATLISLQLQSGSLNYELMLAAICSTIIIAFLGLLDDVLDIPDRYRVIIPAFAALPLMVTKAGESTMHFIFFTVNFNLGVYYLPVLGPVTLNLYPLLLIPIGVVACSNLVNLLAGFNGLEAGVGAVASLFIGLAALVLYAQGGNGSVEAAFLMFALFGACVGFLLFNWFPAKMFPGNIATYLIGAAIVSAVVIGNMERVGVIALVPQIIEFLLKATSRFKAENFGVPDKLGRLHYKGRIHSLTHLFMKLFSPTEPQLVGMLLLLQALFGALALLSVFI